MISGSTLREERKGGEEGRWPLKGAVCAGCHSGRMELMPTVDSGSSVDRTPVRQQGARVFIDLSAETKTD